MCVWKFGQKYYSADERFDIDLFYYEMYFACGTVFFCFLLSTQVIQNMKMDLDVNEDKDKNDCDVMMMMAMAMGITACSRSSNLLVVFIQILFCAKHAAQVCLVTIEVEGYYQMHSLYS